MEAEANERGERYVWLAPAMVDRLVVMRGPGESYSDAILRLTKAAKNEDTKWRVLLALPRSC